MRGVAVAACVWPTVTSTAAAQGSAPPTSAQLERIDHYVAARLENGRIPGAALAIVHGDSMVYLRAYGVADPTGRAVTPATPFILGSTTKAITATAVMQLVDAGRVALDSPVVRYVPWFQTADARAWARITVRDLLNQTSGLSESVGRARLADGDTGASALERHVRALSTTRLVHDPGSTFEYSNANYSTLGMVIQEVTSTSYETYVRDQVFAPLGMRDSYTSQRTAEEHGLATGYRFWFGLPRAAPDLPFVRGAGPAGYLIASAGDLAHFVIAHLNDGVYRGTAVASSDAIAELHHPAVRMGPDLFYGMGWVVQGEGDERLLWHNGGIPNYYSFLALLPEREIGIVFVGNALDVMLAQQFDAIPLGVIDLLRGREPEVGAEESFHPVIGIAVLYILIVVVCQLFWIVASALWRRPWRRFRSGGRIGTVGAIARLVLPLVLNFGWAYCVLMYLPAAQGASFPVLQLYAPDAGLLLLTSAALAVVWGAMQVAFGLAGLLRGPPPAAAA